MSSGVVPDRQDVECCPIVEQGNVVCPVGRDDV